MMNYQSSGRNQRPKGFKVKQAMQFSFLLAVCIWLLYQFKHSYDKRVDYGGSTQNWLSKEYGVILGRKGNDGLSSDGGESDIEGVNVVEEGEKKKEDGVGGDDELDRSAEEKTEEESFHKDSEHRLGNGTTHVENEDKKEPRTQYKESQNNEDNKDVSKEEYFGKGSENSHGKVLAIDEQREEDTGRQVSHDEQRDEKDPETRASHDEQGDEKDPETQVKVTQNTKEDNADAPIQDKEETVVSYKENAEDKEPTKSEEKIAMQPSGMENATVQSQSAMVNIGVLGFHDENGVPQDGNRLIESMPIESSDDQSKIIPPKSFSSLNNQSRISESMPEVEEAATKEGSSSADETESKSILEHTKNETNDAEINSETSAHTDI